MEKIIDYYKVLNISKNAGKAEIKRAYKKMVKQYHPDLYEGDKNFAEQKIKEINEAYTILSNPEKKANYDEMLFYTSEQNTVYTATSNSSETSPSSEESAFTNFLIKKLNLLSTKRQLLLFLTIFMITLALFLVNLLKLKEYFEIHPTTNSAHYEDSTSKNTTYHHSENDDPFSNHDYQYSDDTTNTLNDMFNDFLKSYFEEDI